MLESLKKMWQLMARDRDAIHTWKKVEQETPFHPQSRVCSVCGELQELDVGGGMCSSMWMVEKSGDKSKHVS